MSPSARTGLALLACLPLTGCYVNMHGVQSTGGGANTTAVSSQVGGAARFSNGVVAFSSGQVPPPGTPGGHVALGKGGSVVLVTAVVLADFFSYIVGDPRPKALPPAGTKILETCSCYKKDGDEVTR